MVHRGKFCLQGLHTLRSHIFTGRLDGASDRVIGRARLARVVVGVAVCDGSLPYAFMDLLIFLWV